MGSELTSEIVPGPTAVIVGESISGELDTVREIEPPARHLGDIAVARQTEAVRELQSGTDEYLLPTLRSENLLHRVRVELRRRKAERRIFSRHVQRPL